MTYDYIKKTYGVDPIVGGRVQHTVTHKSGTIKRENKSQAHYVMVQFDKANFALPCHPTELRYEAPLLTMTLLLSPTASASNERTT